MDAIYWQKHWQGLADQDFLREVATVVQQPAFVLDGNHSKTNPIKWSAIDTVIWIDLGFWRTFSQVLQRSIKRSISGKEVWPGTGNKETFKRNFFSSQSVIWWMLKNYWKTKTKYRALLKSNTLSHCTIIHLTSRKATESFLANAVKSEDFKR